jgi:hypothetical protein
MDFFFTLLKAVAVSDDETHNNNPADWSETDGAMGNGAPLVVCTVA